MSTKETLTNRLAELQSELTSVNQALLTAVGKEHDLFEMLIAILRQQITELMGNKRANS
jgi:hypothetical protein